MSVVWVLALILREVLRPRAALVLENLALRQQLAVRTRGESPVTYLIELPDLLQRSAHAFVAGEELADSKR